ncbi:ABC transporter ATP-binding protein [Bacillus sp. LR_5]|uniref:ABC transporter ATP-binding protein n=1 Tax=Bacillus sp. LR_5 TaxID=3055784 RepID=UPI00090ACC4F|nr:hypothetical protein BAX60_02025 [Bacillus subtilis]
MTTQMNGSFTWKRVFSLAGKKWGLLSFIIFTILVQSILSPITPIIVAEIIDKGFSGTSKFGLEKLIMILLAIGICQIVMHIVQDILITIFTNQIIFNVREGLFRKLYQQSIRFFTDTKIGEITSRLTNEAESIANTVFKPIVYTSQTALSLVVTFIAMVAISWKLSIVILLLIPLFFLPMPLIGRFAYKYSKKLITNISFMNSFLTENISINGVILNKIFGRRRQTFETFKNVVLEINKLTLKQKLLGSIFDNLLALAAIIAPLFVYWFGRPGGPFEISAGMAVALSGYIASLFNPIQEVGRIGIMLQSAKITFERFFEYLDMKPELEEPKDPIIIHDIKGNIELRDVTFSYKKEEQTLKNLSIRIPAGSKVSIVGFSGSGKTTIAYLLTRLYKPDKGGVYIDGHDLERISSDYISKYIGMISQEVYLLHTSIKENIMLGNPNASIEEVHEAAKQAYIHEKIIGLPDGYDTIVGERGYKLSGGEKQRIAIARAILQNPSILILDEATSSLDSKSQYIVQNALNELTKGRTVITIAHRMSVTQSSDRIYVLDKGEIVQAGTHERLLEEEGLYRELYHTQNNTELAEVN